METYYKTNKTKMKEKNLLGVSDRSPSMITVLGRYTMVELETRGGDGLESNIGGGTNNKQNRTKFDSPIL